VPVVTDDVPPADVPPAGAPPGDTPTAVDVDRLGELADDLLPRLITRFGASGLGELEIRRQGWRVRMRREVEAGQADPAPRRHGKGRPGDGRAGDGAGAHGTMDGSASRHPGGRSHDGGSAAAAADERGRVTVTSPQVGYFTPRAGLEIGARVQKGDLLGHIDVLGVRHDVDATADGVVGRLLAEPGEAVEYGQPLVRVDRFEHGAST
jgi:biotin carboxyl carrier protein